jgi:hypothetical protein
MADNASGVFMSSAYVSPVHRECETCGKPPIVSRMGGKTDVNRGCVRVNQVCARHSSLLPSSILPMLSGAMAVIGQQMLPDMTDTRGVIVNVKTGLFFSFRAAYGTFQQHKKIRGHEKTEQADIEGIHNNARLRTELNLIHYLYCGLG